MGGKWELFGMTNIQNKKIQNSTKQPVFQSLVLFPSGNCTWNFTWVIRLNLQMWLPLASNFLALWINGSYLEWKISRISQSDLSSSLLFCLLVVIPHESLIELHIRFNFQIWLRLLSKTLDLVWYRNLAISHSWVSEDGWYRRAVIGKTHKISFLPKFGGYRNKLLPLNGLLCSWFCLPKIHCGTPLVASLAAQH